MVAVQLSQHRRAVKLNKFISAQLLESMCIKAPHRALYRL